jgi:replicative DNA helicase
MAEKTIFSNDSEVAVLSIILKNPDMVHELDGLKSFMFGSNVHISLFAEIQEMIEKQIRTEPALIIAQLEANNTIGLVGGKRYIEQLCTYDYNKDTLSEYRNIVIKAYKARSLISIGASVSNVDRVNIDSVDEQISSVKKALDGILEVRGGSQTIHIGDSVKGVYEDIVAGLTKSGLRGSSWGIKSLDAATGGKCAGELIVIGGRPGQGKSSVIFNSIYNDALAGVPSLLFEREMRTQEVTERLVSLDTSIPITNIRLRILSEKQIKQIRESLERIKTLPIYIDTSYRSTDPYYIESTVNKYRNLHDIKVVYLDYIQILVDRDDNQTNEIGKYSRLFKTLANELDICTIMASQLNRAVELRDNKRPILSDLRQSGNLEEDADIVVGLYRDEYYNKETRFKNLLEFAILKYRNGPPGVTTVKFENETNRISETDG